MTPLKHITTWLLLLSVITLGSAVSAKTALGGYQANLGSSMGETTHNPLNELGNNLDSNCKALGFCNGADKTIDRFPSGSQPDLTIKKGQQNKHIENTNEYKTASQNGTPRSMLDPTADPQKLVDEYAGTGQHVNPNKASLGQPGSVERIKTNSPIGEFVDANGVNHGPTNNFTIKYAKDGVHIVPAAP